MDYLSIIIGIITSVVFFYISYTKTIGARNERANASYEDIVKILVRNLVNNDYIPLRPEINRIITTKAIEKRFNISDLPDEVTFIFALYTRILEDEIISPNEKKALVEKINKYLESEESYEYGLDQSEVRLIDREKIQKIILIILSLMTAVGTVIITLLKTDFKNESKIFPTILMALIVTSITLFILNYFLSLKEEQNSPKDSKKIVFNEYKNFEERIFNILRPFNPNKEFMISNGRHFDFSFTNAEQNYFVETKLFQRYVSKSIINRLKKQALYEKELNRNSILILVVNNKKYLDHYLNELGDCWDYVFDEIELKNFRNELVHNT